jgi:hypothetical protein
MRSLNGVKKIERNRSGKSAERTTSVDHWAASTAREASTVVAMQAGVISCSGAISVGNTNGGI